jgi:hypothetical protein
VQEGKGGNVDSSAFAKEISGKSGSRSARVRTWITAAATGIALSGSLTPAFATTGYSATNATITQVLASAGAFYIYVSVAPTGGTNSCATQTVTAYRFVINPTAPGTGTVIATALAAHSAGGTIDIYGTGACDVWPDTETINFIIAH